MTERQWLSHTWPASMVRFLTGTVSGRKLRLYACACARWRWAEPPDGRCQLAVETAERFADGLATAVDLAAVYWPARRAGTEFARRSPDDPRQYNLLAFSDAAYPDAYSAAHTGVIDAGWTEVGVGLAHPALADLAREVFGNPFRPSHLDPRWRSSDVVGLARAIYDGRAFDRLPILADALIDAGCDDPEILGHCQGPGPHVRGCWVIDLLLGRS